MNGFASQFDRNPVDDIRQSNLEQLGRRLRDDISNNAQDGADGDSLHLVNLRSKLMADLAQPT